MSRYVDVANQIPNELVREFMPGDSKMVFKFGDGPITEVLQARLRFEKRILQERLSSIFSKSPRTQPHVESSVGEKRSNSVNFFRHVKELIDLDSERRNNEASIAAYEERIQDSPDENMYHLDYQNTPSINTQAKKANSPSSRFKISEFGEIIKEEDI